MSLLKRSRQTSEYLQALAADRSQVALLVIDIQKCFIDKSPDLQQKAIEINKFAKAFRNAGGQVYTIHFTTRGSKETAPDFERYTPDESDITIAKSYYSAFKQTGLDETLQANAHSRLLLSGFFFNVCVQDTALDAVRLGYEPALLKDLTDYFMWTARPYHDAEIPMVRARNIREALQLYTGQEVVFRTAARPCQSSRSRSGLSLRYRA